MNRSPSPFRSTPPSPRTPSVTRMPLTDGGHTMPVGWNCTNSMSMRSAPAHSASAWPSPVYSQEFDVIFQALPIPPVARITDLARNTTNAPDSRQYASAPEIRSPSVSSENTVHSMNTSIPRCTAFCWSVRIISRPVRSPTCARRAYRCPPKSRWRIRPSSVRSNSAPHSSSSYTRSGASRAWIWAMRQLLSIFPPRMVSRKWTSQLSSG